MPVEFKDYATSTLPVLDLVGAFVVALSGAVAGAGDYLDLFGVLGLSVEAGNAGDIAHDVLIGVVPPQPSATGDMLPSLYSLVG